MTTKKVPQRMCIVCKQMFDKKDLVRILKTEDDILVDITGKKNGRGAYVCKNGCILNCEKTHALDRAFKIAVEKEQYQKIVKEFDELVR